MGVIGFILFLALLALVVNQQEHKDKRIEKEKRAEEVKELFEIDAEQEKTKEILTRWEAGFAQDSGILDMHTRRAELIKFERDKMVGKITLNEIRKEILGREEAYMRKKAIEEVETAQRKKKLDTHKKRGRLRNLRRQHMRRVSLNQILNRFRMITRSLRRT